MYNLFSIIVIMKYHTYIHVYIYVCVCVMEQEIYVVSVLVTTTYSLEKYQLKVVVGG